MPRPRILVGVGAVGLFGLVASGQTDEAGELEAYTGYGGEDPGFVLPNQPIEGAMGFSKSVLETPRSVSVISAEMISSMSISEVSDLSRIAPSTNTTTRWGVQGNIDIRNMTADTYFRGMKRIEPQGNSRTVLGANDQIEIVRGPPPAYFGAGKIGGYTNMTPKSGRSREGAYLTDDSGFIQGILGEYQKREISFGYGGPLSIVDGRRGGYYVYGLIEDSESFLKNVPVEQRVLQVATSQELTENLRIEAGINVQETVTAGGFRNRLRQEDIDNGTYWAGRPLVNLDVDGSGKISQQEMVLGSPVGGALGPVGSTNRDLSVRFGGSSPANGSRFVDALAGDIPTAATTNANSALDALRQMRPDFVALMEGNLDTYGDNLRLLNVLQQGMVFDPDSMALTEANYHYIALEKELQARLGLVYFDLIHDSGGPLTFKNQVLIDTMDQFKDSELPFYQKQDIFLIEDKFTVGWRPSADLIPDWMRVNTISAVNIRHTDAERFNNSGDYDDRPDLSRSENSRTPYDTFITPRENADYETGGAPFTSMRNTIYTEAGIGSMVDIDIQENLNIILGARFDHIWGKTKDYGGRYQIGTDGEFDDSTLTGSGTDHGISYTVSVSYRMPFGLNPYVTYGRQTALSDSSDLTLPRNLVEAGPYDPATIEEVGIKGSWFEDRLFWAVAAYRQERSSVTGDLSGNPLTGGLGNLRSEGVEIEVRYAPTRNLWLSAFSVFSTVEYLDTASWVRVHGEALGFSDVLDPQTGALLFPAEAFTWGGQAMTFVPADQNTEVNGYPSTSLGLAGQYTFDNGFSFGGSTNYISAVHSGRYESLILPSDTTVNLTASYTIDGWRIKVDVFNVADKQSFRGRNGGGAGDVLISAMPGRRSQLTVSKTF